MEHLSYDHKDRPNKREDIHKLCDEKGHWRKVKGNWGNNMIRFPNGGKATIEQILASEEINKSKRAGLWESQSEIPVGKLTIWVRSFETKNCNRAHQVYQKRLISPYDER